MFGSVGEVDVDGDNSVVAKVKVKALSVLVTSMVCAFVEVC